MGDKRKMNEYMRMADRMYDLENQMKQLEKENAELKKQLEMSNKVYNDNLDYSHHIEEQFTKAKELLKELVTLDKYYHWNLQLAHDAEQFLSEVHPSS